MTTTTTTTIPAPLSPAHITRLGYGRECCACQSVILPGALSYPAGGNNVRCEVCHHERSTR